MSKKGFAIFEFACAALLAFTYFSAEKNGLLLICAIVLVIDCVVRFFKSDDDNE